MKIYANRINAFPDTKVVKMEQVDYQHPQEIFNKISLTPI